VRHSRIEKDSVSERRITQQQLNNGLRVLKSKIATSSKNHKEKNARILQDNVSLLNEINRYKNEQHHYRQQIKREGYSEAELRASDNRNKGFSAQRRAKSARPLGTEQEGLDLGDDE
jgi:hypothetical protein